MSDTPQFRNTEELLAWLRSQTPSTLQQNSSNTTSANEEEVKPTCIKRPRRKTKIREGEIVAVARAMLDFLNQQCTVPAFDTICHPIEIDSNRCRLGPYSIKDQILDDNCKMRIPTLKLLLDMLDVFVNGSKLPYVKPAVLFWAHKAISAYILHNDHCAPETPPWHELPRNLIAVEILKGIDDVWFLDKHYADEFAQTEAMRIYKENDSVLSEYPKSPFGW